MEEDGSKKFQVAITQWRSFGKGYEKPSHERVL
jgi:hypothetical protein